MKCRHCSHLLHLPLVDLGSAPPSNAYLSKSELNSPEIWYPLRVLICEQCWLAQTEDHADREALFTNEYAYFSSYSSSWLKHARQYVYRMISMLNLNETSQVVEIAANDGYLLQYLKQSKIPCLGVEPTASTSIVAREKGLEIIEDFFGVALAKTLVENNKQADLLIANNVLAHVPDINDFVRGFSLLLKPNGVATFEFPYLLHLLQSNQFDTIYHEHYSYISLYAANKILRKNGLVIFNVEELNTHGGSLRLYAQRTDTGKKPISNRVLELLHKEELKGLKDKEYYRCFQKKAETIKDNLLNFLIDIKRQGKKIIGYGAAAKGNTLLNFCGIRPDLLPYVEDRNPAKQGKFLPGSRIPIVKENTGKNDQPDYILILPWNLRDEIITQLKPSYPHTIFVTAIPELSFH